MSQLRAEILAQLKAKLQAELEILESAANETLSYKQSDDLSQEGKYDTRAIEAGYLAGAQQKRVEEVKQEIQLIDSINLESNQSHDIIELGSVVSLKHNNQVQYYFISSTAGGTILDIQQKKILVTTVFSPLGSQLLGLSVGEVCELETPKGEKSFEVLEIIN